jgi:hypothetical protein
MKPEAFYHRQSIHTVAVVGFNALIHWGTSGLQRTRKSYYFYTRTVENY